MKRKISVNDLKVGYVLEEDIKTGDGKILIKKGTVLTENLIIRLRQWNAKNDCVLVVDDCKEEIEKKDLQEKVTTSLENVLSASQEELSKAVLDLDSYVSHVYDDLKTIEDLPEDIIKIQFANTRGGHYFRLMAMSCALASLYNKEMANGQEISLHSIALAAVLHDYGKRFRNDPTGLGNLKIAKNDTETAEMLSTPYRDEHQSVFYHLKVKDMINGPYIDRYHSAYAYVALKDVVPEDVRATILYSNSTKESFQRKPKYNTVIKAANIIAISDAYDTLLEYVVREVMSTPFENVISYMDQLVHNGSLDSELYSLFLKHIPIYPTGSKVLLSNDQYAVVVRRSSSFPTKPLVLTLPPAAPVLIDLSETTNITIRRVVKTDEHASDKVDSIQREQLEGFMTNQVNITSEDDPSTVVLRREPREQSVTLGKRFKGFLSPENKK